MSSIFFSIFKIKFVDPEIKNINEIEKIKRKSKFEILNKKYEFTILENIKKIAIQRKNELAKVNLIEIKKNIDFYRVIQGEIKSVQILIEMIEISLKILQFPIKTQAIDYYISLEKRPTFCNYIENELLNLYWD